MMKLNELSREKYQEYKKAAKKGFSKAKFDLNKHQKLERHADKAYYRLSREHDRREFPTNNAYKASLRDMNHQWGNINRHIQGQQVAHNNLRRRKKGLDLVNKRLIATGSKSGLSSIRLDRYATAGEKSSNEKFIKATNRALSHRHHDSYYGHHPINTEIQKNYDKSASRARFVKRAKNILGSRLKKHFPGHIKESHLNDNMKLLREIVENKKPIKTILIDVDLFNDNMMLLNEFAQPQRKTQSDMKNLHLDHIEDLIIRDGKEGWDAVQKILKSTFRYITSKGGTKANKSSKGKKRSKGNDGFRISTKIDGSPALIIGRDSKDGRFFVGTKSFFSSAPKINYSHEDIRANHSNSPGLARKLSHALDHLPKVAPKTGIFQGDMIFSHDDKIDDGKGKISFQPNTLTYSHPLVDKDGKPNKDGERIKNAKIGFAPHTEYKDIGNGEMRAHYNNPVSKFNRNHPDVYIMDPRLSKDSLEITPQKKTQFKEYMIRAGDAHKKLLKGNGYLVIRDHEPLLLGYINGCIAERRNPNTAGYIAWVKSRYKEKAKSLGIKGKNKASMDLDYALAVIAENRSAMAVMFQMHEYISKAKNILIDALSKGSKFEHSYQGNPSKAEGFVATHGGRATKLVDRKHFSAANFEWNKKVNPEDDPMVISWGRMNPPHAGHEKIINQGAELAQRMGAKHQVYMTNTKDDKDNPLDPQVKLKHAQTLFPGKNIALAGPDTPTIIGQLSHLCAMGVKDITIICGPDRRAGYQQLVTQYNGDGKPFKFNRIRVVAAGERNDKADGVEGVSGSKQRDAVKKNDFKGFRKGMPSTSNEKHAKRMFGDLKKAMGVLQVDKIQKKKPTLGQTVQAAIREK